MGLKNGCFDNGSLWYVFFLQYVHMCRQYLAGRVLYEIQGLVGSYDFERCALLMLVCFYNFVVLKIKGSYYVGYVIVVVL